MFAYGGNMKTEDKKIIASQLFKNTEMNKEQYEVFKDLVDDLDLDIPEKKQSLEDMLGAL